MIKKKTCTDIAGLFGLYARGREFVRYQIGKLEL